MIYILLSICGLMIIFGYLIGATVMMNGYATKIKDQEKDLTNLQVAVCDIYERGEKIG